MTSRLLGHRFMTEDLIQACNHVMPCMLFDGSTARACVFVRLYHPGDRPSSAYSDTAKVHLLSLVSTHKL